MTYVRKPATQAARVNAATLIEAAWAADLPPNHRSIATETGLTVQEVSDLITGMVDQRIRSGQRILPTNSVTKPTRPLWHCPPGRKRVTGVGPWCDRLPCQGHRAGDEQRAVARVLAHQDGLQLHDLDNTDRDRWLARARQALHDAGPNLGVPR